MPIPLEKGSEHSYFAMELLILKPSSAGVERNKGSFFKAILALIVAIRRASFSKTRIKTLLPVPLGGGSVDICLGMVPLILKPSSAGMEHN